MATWVNYSFVTSQSDDCVLIPGSAVKSVLDKDGNPQTVVFIKADSKRAENTLELDLPEVEPGQKRTLPPRTATIRRGGDRYLGYPERRDQIGRGGRHGGLCQL